MNVAGGERGQNDGQRIRRACNGLVYQRVRILDVARESGDETKS